MKLDYYTKSFRPVKVDLYTKIVFLLIAVYCLAMFANIVFFDFEFLRNTRLDEVTLMILQFYGCILMLKLKKGVDAKKPQA
jgi:hypothetical protein